MQADRIDKALRMHIPIMTMSASDEVTDNLVGARAERCVTPLAARFWMGYDPGMPEPGAAKGWLLIIIARDNVDFNTRSAACYLNLKTGQFKAEKWTPYIIPKGQQSTPTPKIRGARSTPKNSGADGGPWTPTPKIHPEERRASGGKKYGDRPSAGGCPRSTPCERDGTVTLPPDGKP